MKNEDNILNKLTHYSELFDYYEALFTDKQKMYFKDYYFYDLSLSEIATNYNISRSAVYDTINKMHQSLDEYESKLGLAKQKKNLITTLDKYEELGKDDKLVLELISKIRKGI